MIIYFSDVSSGSFCNEVHHTKWLSEMKSRILSSQEIQIFLRYLRYWKQKNEIKIPTSVIDFIAYAVSNKFNNCSASRNLINFFEFVANEGLNDVILTNKRNIDVTQMHYEIIKNLDKADSDNFVRIC